MLGFPLMTFLTLITFNPPADAAVVVAAAYSYSLHSKLVLYLLYHHSDFHLISSPCQPVSLSLNPNTALPSRDGACIWIGLLSGPLPYHNLRAHIPASQTLSKHSDSQSLSCCIHLLLTQTSLVESTIPVTACLDTLEIASFGSTPFSSGLETIETPLDAC